MLSRFKLAACCSLALGAAIWFGCAVPRAPLPMKAAFDSGALIDDLDPQSLRVAIRHSMAYLQRLPADRVVGAAPRSFTAEETRETLLAFDKLLDLWHCRECFVRELNARFELLPSSADTQFSDVLFTGYYQPVLEGSLTRTEKFRYPIYGPPADLLTAEQVTLEPKRAIQKVVGRADGETFTPYHSRLDIDQAGFLEGRGLEIAWVADPIDLFFLHIQGSGIVRLPDGQQLNVGYAAQNGRPYRSIGRLLIDRGKLAREEVSMQRLRQYLDENPQERDEIFAYNESYVFFRILENGPLGSLEVPVTAGRSIATDSRLFPKGAIVWIQTQTPILDRAGRLAAWRPIARFVLNQDTGGAIRGLQRADLYFGTGDEPAGLAGYMNRPGKIFFLVLKRNR